MSSVAVDIAKEVTSELDGGTFTQTFTPERSYADWDEELSDLDTLHVDVVLGKVQPELIARGRLSLTATVFVVVRKRLERDSDGKIAPDAADGADALVELVQEFLVFFTKKTLAGDAKGIWLGMDCRAVFLDKHMRKMGQFTSVITLKFSSDVSV